RLADAGMGENAVAAVEPAVRSPAESVERLVGVLVVPAIQKDLWFPGRLVYSLLDRHKHEIGGCTDPDAPEAHFQPANEIEPLHEDGALVEFALACRVLEDQDAILGLLIGPAHGIAISFGHPESAAIIQAHGDGLANVGLAGTKGDREAFR